MPGFGTRKDGRVYPKLGQPSDIEAIASAPSDAAQRLSLYAEGEDGSDQAEREKCVRCQRLTKYRMGDLPVCRKCYEEG